MIIKIALGLLLGFIFIVLACIIVGAFAMAIADWQADHNKSMPRPQLKPVKKPRSKPETQYEQTQRLVRKARKENPQNWKEGY